MEELKNQEEINQAFFEECRVEAIKSRCKRSKCGSIIVSDGKIIGSGHNSPPNNDATQERCSKDKKDYNSKVTDKTCCIHAEQRAIFDALRFNSNRIKGSTIYFVRLDEDGNKKFSKEPYCTICSKMCLDVGIKYFVLNKKEDTHVYNTTEYNNLSFDYVA